MGKAIKAAKEIAEKHEAAVQELRNKAGDKADELLAEAEKLAASTTMTQTEAVYAVIQKMTDEASAQASEAAETLAQLGKPEAPAPSVTLEDLEGMDDALWTQEETEGPRPAWRITDDGCADWARGILRDGAAQGHKDQRELPPAVWHTHAEIWRRTNEAGRRPARPVPQRLRPAGVHQNRRKTEVGRLQKTA